MLSKARTWDKVLFFSGYLGTTLDGEAVNGKKNTSASYKLFLPLETVV